MTAETDAGRAVELGLRFTPGERAVPADGGLLAHIRAGGRSSVPAAC